MAQSAYHRSIYGPVGGEETTATAPQEQAATSIAWSDEAAAPEQTPAYTEAAVDQQVATGGEPEVATTVDQNIAADDGSGTKRELEGKTDKETVEKTAAIVKESTGSADALSRLLQETEKNIRTLEDKRKSVKLLALGISLLGGKGSSAAAQIANDIASLGDDRIEELYETRGQIIDKAKAALGLGTTDVAAKSSVFGDTYVDPDGNFYYKLKDRAGYEGPDGEVVASLPSGSVKQGTQGADLPSTVLKTISTLTDEADSADANAERFDYIIEDIDQYGGAEGIFGAIGEFVKNTFGWQGGTSEWKTKYRDIKNSTAIQNLPPGVASDRDIQIVMAGFPQEHWDKGQLKNWIRGYQKLLRYQATYKRFRSDWIADNRGSTKGMRDAWVNSETYKEWSAANVETSEGAANTAVSGQTYTTSGGISYTVEGG